MHDCMILILQYVALFNVYCNCVQLLICTGSDRVMFHVAV